MKRRVVNTILIPLPCPTFLVAGDDKKAREAIRGNDPKQAITYLQKVIKSRG